MSFPLYRCAACGSPHVVETTQTDGIKYDFVKGAIGTVVLGTGGAVAGVTNRTKKAYQCPDCGLTLDHPMPMELKCSIDLGVSSSRMRNGILVGGMQFTWEEITKQFRNIESGDGDEEIAQGKMSEEELLLSKATATQEEFDRAFDTLHQYATQKYSTKNLPTKKEYKNAVAALYTVVENCYKYLPPNKIERGYKSTPYRGWKNFHLDDCIDEYTLFRYYELTGKFMDNVFTNINDPCDINTIKLKEPFLELLFSRYKFEVRYCGLWRYLKSDNSANFKIGIPRAPESDDDLLFWQVRVLLGGFATEDNSLDNIRTMVAVPTLWTDEDGFYYTDWAFPDTPLFQAENRQESALQTQLFFDNFPEKKAEYDELLNEYRTALQTYNRAKEEAKATVQQIEEKIKVNEEKIVAFAPQKKEYTQQINTLSAKIFGKAKAQAEIERLQGLLSEIEQQEEQLSAENKALSESLEAKKKAQNDDSKKKYENLRIIRKRIIGKMNYFLVLHPIEEIEEEKEDTPSEPLTEEIKIAEPDNQNGSSPNPSVYADQLRELKALLDEGILTQEEFDAKKRQILGL